MALHVYEGLYILDSSKYSSDQAGVSGQLSAIVQKHGGQMLASRLWEDRRLAYPIRGRRTGTYWLTYFRIDSEKVPQIEHEAKLNETILRSLVIKIEPRIADAVVTHAQSSTPTQIVTRGPERGPPMGRRREEAAEVPVGE